MSLMLTTNGDVLVLLLDKESLVNKVHEVVSSWTGRIEQAAAQREGLPPINTRRMEFEAVKEIAEVLGVKL